MTGRAERGPGQPTAPGLPHSPLAVGTIWTYDLQQPPVEVTPLTPVTFREVGVESVALIAREAAAAEGSAGAGQRAPIAARLAEIEAAFTRRLATGRRCFAAWAGERPAAYGWVSFGEEYVGELGLRLTLEPGEAYIWDCFTFPAFREQRLYSALLVFILDELRAAETRRAWIGADLANAPSQRGIDRAGFTRVADLLLDKESQDRRIWAAGYPGVPGSLVAEAERVYLGSG